MENNIYYDGTKLLSLKDLNGKDPEIYISDGNRTAGKTTYFNRLLVNRYKKKGALFALLFRYNQELQGNIADRFFNDIKGLFFPSDEMTQKGNKKFIRLFLNGELCGFALALNSSDFYKKNSHLFNKVNNILFDEFQPESGRYLPDELTKLQSIHTSISRGQGELVRRVPLIMVSNSVDIINPYYTAFGISERLTDQTKYLKGNGFVMEHVFNAAAAAAQLESGFNEAFSGSNYSKLLVSHQYINNSAAFIGSPKGPNKFVCNFIENGRYYGIYFYFDEQIIYVSDTADKSRLTYALTPLDHFPGSVLIQPKSPAVSEVRHGYNVGAVRFKNQQCKHSFYKFIAI